MMTRVSEGVSYRTLTICSLLFRVTVRVCVCVFVRACMSE
jgi:hypothetical protein